MTPKVVTPMDAAPNRPPESVTVTVHDPAATEVTLNVPLGPVPLAGETVAIPLHVFDSVRTPL